MQIPTLPKTVPYLPGHMFQDTLGERHHKIQQLYLVNNVPQEKTNYISEALDVNLIDAMKTKAPLNLTYGNRAKPENEFIPRIQPPWLKYDRQVLKFTCYFQEAVVENPIENFRIRKCNIYYYLSDGTIHVNEPKSENSGLPQGLFIKRQKIPKKLGSTEAYYTWEDLNIGININFYQRVFRVVDADDFTKQFYNYMGCDLQSPEELPTDNYDKFKSLKEVKINPPDTKEYKEYNEVKLKGGHPNGGLQQYIANDRKVLSFSIQWEDNTLEGGLNYYTLNYFLGDSTVEIKEIRSHNSGKDPYPLMLNRKKLPKQPINTHYPGMTLKKEEFYQPEDLMIGQKVVIHSKNCLLYNCDEFTKQWYEQNLGVMQEPIQLQQSPGQKFYQQVPPYNGYGSEEDSLGSVFALQPKPPRKDVKKIYCQDPYILRFDARLISETKENNDRTFIISFYCGDDTAQVYEVADKNSGIWRGKFLERSKHICPISKRFYEEQDFQIGQTVQLGAYKFQLLRADEFTHRYFKSKPDVFKSADINTVLLKLRQPANRYPSFNDYLVDLIRKLDKKGYGVINFNELATGLQELGFNLTYQEQYTLMRQFDRNGQWLLDVKELFVALGGSK